MVWTSLSHQSLLKSPPWGLPHLDLLELWPETRPLFYRLERELFTHLQEMRLNMVFLDQLQRRILEQMDLSSDSALHPITMETRGLDSVYSHDSVKLIKFADDTTLIGLISNNDESAYRREVDRLVSWCSGNNLELNAQKTVEMIVDFRKSTVPPPPPSVMDSPITSVESFRFLGTTITQDLKWEPTISSLIKKAQQRMYFLRQLRKAKLPAQMLVQFYTAIIESILTSSITVWFAGATVRDKQRLQRIVRSAEEVIGRSLPSLQDLLMLLISPGNFTKTQQENPDVTAAAPHSRGQLHQEESAPQGRARTW
uniref:Alkylated DNA repair protein AlkB homologue 8 N-terminal domain-containing protein n=1 Tax=Knipowitschia caucasica TaxID=637954 RepID=A0AAV2J804_KNICA